MTELDTMDRNLKVHWDDVMGKALTIRLLAHCTAIIRMPGCCLVLMQGITCNPVTVPPVMFQHHQAMQEAHGATLVKPTSWLYLSS